MRPLRNASSVNGLERRRANPKPTGPLPRPSVTDWIQAIALLFGVAVAIWQFVLTDRALERQRTQAVSDLILVSQGDSMRATYASLAKHIGSGEVNWASLDLRVDLATLGGYLEAWGFCVANDLCDRKLALQYICRDTTTFAEWAAKTTRASDGIYAEKISPPLASLIVICRVDQGKPPAAVPGFK